MEFGTACTETVSLFEALLLETGDACVSFGMSTLIGAVCVFVGGVVVLRFLGITALRQAFPSLQTNRPSDVHADAVTPASRPETLKRKPYESPIQSTGAWGSKRR